MTVKMMFSFPDQLASRIKSSIPARERSKVIATLFEKEITLREQALYRSAKELEEHKGLNEEIHSWDSTFGGDGLDEL